MFAASEKSRKQKQKAASKASMASQHKSAALAGQRISVRVKDLWGHHVQHWITGDHTPRGTRQRRITKKGSAITTPVVELPPPEWPLPFYQAVLAFAQLESKPITAMLYIHQEFKHRCAGRGKNKVQRDVEGLIVGDVEEAMAEWRRNKAAEGMGGSDEST
ncbi:hypothetical protein LTR97_008414 [Elasticomyces elasticus]|uniref:Uncharacterized protein n=1 Tax=Elasticomyces elasticus TaxID=574655 RepID=A0AAN7W7S4_9PEZI|nr:hypothetical protein LTR97_008414 [Elasticomyces elasticus]